MSTKGGDEREKTGPQEESAGCFLKAEKGENEVFHGVEVFSSRPKKT
jgi:hypothetical protein